MTTNNLGEATLIIGSIYLYYAYGLPILCVVLSTVFGVYCWTIERTNKEMRKLEIRKMDLECRKMQLEVQRLEA